MGTETTIDLDGRYTVDGYRGIAFYLLGYAVRQEPILVWHEDEDGNEWEDESDEWDEVEDRTKVRAVMVGDDRVHVVDIEDLTSISEDDYCPGCGQVGCKAYG